MARGPGGDDQGAVSGVEDSPRDGAELEKKHFQHSNAWNCIETGQSIMQSNSINIFSEFCLVKVFVFARNHSGFRMT